MSAMDCGVSHGIIFGKSVRFGVEALCGGDGVGRMDATLGMLWIAGGDLPRLIREE